MFVPRGFGCGSSKSSPGFVRFVVTGRNHVWLVVAVVVFEGGHAAFQTLTVRLRQAVAKIFASFVLLVIFTIVWWVWC